MRVFRFAALNAQPGRVIIIRTLGRAVRRKDVGGEPLPVVFPSLAQQKAHIRRSEFTMIAGPPGAGKSRLALWMTTQWVDRHGLYVLYLSADSSELVMASRAAAMLSGTPVSEVETRLARGDETVLGILDDLVGMDFSFEPDISLENMDLELEAFVEKYGRAPDAVVVDNLTDVEGQEADEFSALRRVAKTCTYVARTSGAAVIGLHHTSEDPRIKNDPCPPRHAIHGKIAQKPAVILTTAEHGRVGFQPVAVVKNRFGDSDRDGRNAVRLAYDVESMRYQDLGIVT